MAKVVLRSLFCRGANRMPYALLNSESGWSIVSKSPPKAATLMMSNVARAAQTEKFTADHDPWDPADSSRERAAIRSVVLLHIVGNRSLICRGANAGPSFFFWTC